MVTATPRKGNKGLRISISETALQLLKDNGVTVRKRGKAIETLILEKYAPKSESAPSVVVN